MLYPFPKASFISFRPPSSGNQELPKLDSCQFAGLAQPPAQGQFSIIQWCSMAQCPDTPDFPHHGTTVGPETGDGEVTVADPPMVGNVPSRWPVNGCRGSWQWLVSSPCSGLVASCMSRLARALSNWRAATCMSTFLALFIYPYTLCHP